MIMKVKKIMNIDEKTKCITGMQLIKSFILLTLFHTLMTPTPATVI